MTKLEIAEAFLQHFEDEVEKRAKAWTSAAAKLTEAQHLRDMAEEEVRRNHSGGTASIMDTAAAIVNSGALDRDSVTVTASVSHGSFTDEVAAELDKAGVEYQRDQPLPTVDPITGEVVLATERYHGICPDCGGDGQIDDRTGGGRHRCKACVGSGKISRERPVPPHILVAWPENPDMQTITVGPLTRYGELAADFLSSLPGDDPRREDSFLDYRIVDVDAGSERDPHAVIVASDYGLCFSVEEPVAAEVATP
jgi:hypothetical protein